MMKFFNRSKGKQFLWIVLVVVVSSCKATKVVSGGAVDDRLSAKAVIKAHYQNETNFKTLNGKVRIGYSDGEDSQNVSVSFRMEKDKAIS